MWDEPSLVRFLDRYSSFSRHVWFDPRGRGASDPLPHVEERFAEAVADDMLALLDHLGWEQSSLVGDMQPQILFAPRTPSAPRRWFCSTLALAWRILFVSLRQPRLRRCWNECFAAG